MNAFEGAVRPYCDDHARLYDRCNGPITRIELFLKMGNPSILRKPDDPNDFSYTDACAKAERAIELICELLTTEHARLHAQKEQLKAMMQTKNIWPTETQQRDFAAELSHYRYLFQELATRVDTITRILDTNKQKMSSAGTSRVARTETTPAQCGLPLISVVFMAYTIVWTILYTLPPDDGLPSALFYSYPLFGFVTVFILGLAVHFGYPKKQTFLI